MKKLALTIGIIAGIITATVSALPSAWAQASVTVAQFVGTWTKKDNPSVTWKFNADGTTLTKTSYADIPGTYVLEGKVLSIKGKDVPLKKYDVMELTPNGMKLSDQEYKVVVEFTK